MLGVLSGPVPLPAWCRSGSTEWSPTPTGLLAPAPSSVRRVAQRVCAAPAAVVTRTLGTRGTQGKLRYRLWLRCSRDVDARSFNAAGFAHAGAFLDPVMPQAGARWQAVPTGGRLSQATGGCDRLLSRARRGQAMSAGGVHQRGGYDHAVLFGPWRRTTLSARGLHQVGAWQHWVLPRTRWRHALSAGRLHQGRGGRHAVLHLTRRRLAVPKSGVHEGGHLEDRVLPRARRRAVLPRTGMLRGRQARDGVLPDA
jgi:hypothetical protein